MKQSENWIISKLFNNNSSRRAYSLVWVQGKICQHYKRSRLPYFIFKVVTLIKPEMYNVLIATSQHTSLFFPLGSFLLPAPTALLRPVADSGLVKSSNLSYTWHSRESLRCRDSDSKEKVKKATGRIFDRLKMRTFSRIRNHDFSRKPQHGVATLLRYCFEWLQRCSNIATLCCGVSSPITSP